MTAGRARLNAEAMPEVLVRPVADDGDRERIRALRETIYVQREHRIGHVDDFTGSFDRYEAGSTSFLALDGPVTLGTVRVIPDIGHGLPFEQVTGPVPRGPGEAIVEIGHLLALPGAASSQIVRELLRAAFAHATNVFGATHIVGDVFVDKTRGDAFYRHIGFTALHGPYRDERFQDAPLSMIMMLRIEDVPPMMRAARGLRKALLDHLTADCLHPGIRDARRPD